MTDPPAAPDARDVELAGTLHDTAVQHCTAALMALELVRHDQALPAHLDVLLGDVEEAVRASVDSMRALMRRLDPDGLHARPHHPPPG